MERRIEMETQADYQTDATPTPAPPQRPHLYLMDEHVHSFYPSLAARIGLNEAIVIQQIHSWITTYAKNPKEYAERHWHDGRWWIWNSAPDWHEVLPYLSESTITRALKHLRKLGVVLTGNYNTLKIDRTLWYTIDYAAYDKLWSDQEAKTVSPSSQNDGMETTKMTGPLPSSSPAFSASKEPPTADPLPDSEIDEIAASFKTPPPRERRTAEQVKAGIGKALETFSKNGDGRAGVADPTKAGDDWDAAVVEFCTQFLPGVPADSLPEKKRAHWRSKIRELTEETLNGKATSARAVQVMEPFAALEHWLVGPTTTPYKTSWADGFKVMLVADPRAVRAQTQQGNGRHDGAAGGNRVEGNGFRAMPKGPGR